MNMSAQDCLHTLESLCSSGGRLLFYPSCGQDMTTMLHLPFDVFVGAEKCERVAREYQEFSQFAHPNTGKPRTPSCPEVINWSTRDGKRVCIFVQENREVLDLLSKHAKRIDCFVGIADGCIEGGNFECVNDSLFFSKVIELTPPEGMEYLTDHVGLLSRQRSRSNLESEPHPHERFILGDKMISLEGRSEIGRNEQQWGPVHLYNVRAHLPVVRDVRVGGIRLSIEHDSITNHLGELDGALVGWRCRELSRRLNPTGCKRVIFKTQLSYYFAPSHSNGWTAAQSLKRILHLSERHGWKCAGTTAFGEGDHSSFYEILSRWKGKCPEHVRIFHFDPEDFKGFVSGLEENA